MIIEYIVDKIEGEETLYLSCDTVCKVITLSDDTHRLYPTELLNSLKFPRITNYELKLKVGLPVMLLSNNNQSDGLCNCTRMTILTWKKIHQSTDNNRNRCGRNGIYSKNSHVTN